MDRFCMSESTRYPVAYKGETQLFGVFRDITERNRVYEKLRETEKKYRELAESLPQVIFEIDSMGNLIYLNQKGYELFGYTPEDLPMALMCWRHLFLKIESELLGISCSM